MPQRHTRLTKQDLQFYPTERLHDAPDGGGLMVKDALTGADNELFPPVSDVARTLGAFNARSVHGAVRRPDAEPLTGAHIILADPPKADNVSYLIYRAARYGELREDAVRRASAYSVATIESRMTLMSVQSQGSRIVQAYQRPEEPLPLIGDVYCLRQDKKGYPQHEQYIRVTRVSSEVRTFTDRAQGKEFQRAVVKMEISDPLEHDFIGVDYPDIAYVDNPCKLRETHVADGARFYGVKPLVRAIEAGAMKLAVDGLMEKLVPTSQIETSMLDLTASGQRQVLFDAASGESTLGINRTLAGARLHLGNAVTPGTLKLSGEGVEITERGGNLYASDTIVGSIDYARGELIFVDNAPGSGYITVQFRPAVEFLRVADTAAIAVILNNRSYNYVMTINPAPAPGSLLVSYRAQGRWYDLRDDGSGALRGMSAGHGSGVVNYRSGTVSITCAEMPDVGSEILFAWGSAAGISNRASSRPTLQLKLALEPGVAPNSVQLAWDDGTPRTAQDDGQGNISGHWTGKIDYRSGVILLDSFQGGHNRYDITVTYSVGEPQSKDFKAPNRSPSGRVTLNLGQTQIKPRGFEMTWNVLIQDYDHKVQQGEAFSRALNPVDPYITVRDDGAGALKDAAGHTYGTLDYAAGTVTFNPDCTVSIPKPRFTKQPMGEIVTATQGNVQTVVPLYRMVYAGIEYIGAAATAPIDESFIVTTRFRGQQSEDARNKQLASGTVQIDLLPTIAERLMPGSIRFALGGETYFDRRGDIYYRLDNATGAATRVGTVNYDSGIATVEQFAGGALTLLSLAGSIHGNPVDELVYRIPASPVRVGSLALTATPVYGGQINVRADSAGKISAAGIEGTIDYETGVVRVRFGKLVTAAGNESAYWYNPDAVDSDGKIWQPIPVFAETLIYSAVSYAYLPLDSAVIGIDAVRLPADGRVPIFRRGDMIVIGHRLAKDIGSAHSAGQTVQLSRGDIDDVCLKDSKGKKILAKWYDYDLTQGSITWATPLDLSAYTLPITATTIREEENRILQADIDGTLTLQFPTKRAYPADDTYISSALIGGDLQVRATVPIAQKTWTSVWSDERIGDNIAARLNVKDYPIQLTDDGATTDRWAIVFFDQTQFDLYSEALGFVGRFDVLSDLAPVNPATGKPYFTLPRGAFGAQAGLSPWAARNAIRFNTHGTHQGIWIFRAVQPSAKRQTETDGFEICLRGNTVEIV